MSHAVQIIKSQSMYADALARLSALMDQEIKAGSDKERELELLTLVLQDFESKKVSPAISDPIEAILFSLDQQNLKPKDLVPLIGSMPKVSEVLARKRPLSLAMIRALHKGLGIPAEVLITSTNRGSIDLSDAPAYDYSRFPLSEMLARNCFPGFTGSLSKLKEFAEEQIQSFMGNLYGTKAIDALMRAPMHQSGSRKMDEYALLAWWVCVLKKARSRTLPTKYKKGIITQDWLRDLAKLSRFESGPRLAQEYLADAGIALVIEPHFTKTYLDGAAMLDGTTPIIALTLRHDRVDNFWFALMHELIHVSKHLKPEKAFIADNLEDKTRSGGEEAEADAGAREALIPKKDWESSSAKESCSNDDAMKLANKLRIHPAIVAGRVRFESGNWRLLSSLIGPSGEIKSCFADQL